MREVSVKLIAAKVKEMAVDAAFRLGDREKAALEQAAAREESPLGRQILETICRNFKVAEERKKPLCQDTGLAVVFLDLGQEVVLTGGDLTAEVNQAVRETYTEAYLRKSVYQDPITRRKNTGDNTPAIIHASIVPGDKVRLLFDAKGGGCENMSRIAMLKPADGREGIVRFVTQTIRESSGNPCPPLVVGVGVGGTFEKAAYLAKRALLRPLGEHHPDPYLAELESELLEKANKTGVGPMGLGGTTTALAVHLEAHPCHIASLPVAVNLDCHSHRHRECEI